MVSFDTTPDTPQSFGYKVLWFALKSSDPDRVLDAFDTQERLPANWATGLKAACSKDPWLFVSPPVGGWVLAISFSLPYPVTVEENRDIGKKFDLIFSHLTERFDDVQFFGSYRVCDFVAWARAVKGQPIRIFALVGPDVLANFGEQTPEEAKLGFADLTGLLPIDAGDKLFAVADEKRQARGPKSRCRAFPDESAVLELAELWSINPIDLSYQEHQPGLGLIARLPAHLAQ